MPKQEKTETHSDIEDVSVQLKPILGVRPGIYLSVLYGVALVLVVFFFLFFPGLHHRGAYLTLTTFPPQATVKVDGVYAGTTPTTIFVKKGSRSIELSKPFYSPVTLTRDIRGRVFFTLFVRDRKSLSQALSLADVDGLLKWALADFQKNPQIPNILSDASFAAFGTDSQELRDFVGNALLFTTNESQLKQLLLAAARIASHGAALTPGSFVALLQSGIALTQKYDNFPAWALLTLSSARTSTLRSGPWIQQFMTSFKTGLSRYYQQSSLPASAAVGGVTLEGISFRELPSGDLVMGKDDNLDSIDKSLDRTLPHPVRVDSFYLGATEVTNARYQIFVTANPEWGPANKQALLDKGLVNDSYLEAWKDGRPPANGDNLPVTSVSWYAAQAFCVWLTKQTQGVLPGYAAVLPSESEWEWAARGGLRGMPYPLGGTPGGAVLFHPGVTGPSAAGTSEPNGYGLRDMLGNVWEWCSDPFSLNASILSSSDPRQNAAFEASLPDSPDRAVRGGGWANQPGEDKVYTRGFQPANWCTPYLGFRVALERR